MNRRTLLKSLAAASLVTLNDGCKPEKPNVKRGVPAKDPYGRLNIVLHGMFAISLDNTDSRNLKAWLYAPDVPDHLYAAGAIDVDSLGGTTWLWQQRIGPSTSSKITIPKHPDATKLPSGLQVSISWNTSKIDHLSKIKPPYWNISLPVPDAIWAMRQTSSNILDPNGKTYKDNRLNVTQVPTVYVLTYTPLPDLTAFPMLDGQQIQISKADNVARLHLFAASPFPPTARSLNMAINEMNQMFHDANDKPALDFSFQNVVPPVPIDANTGYPSVLSCEEMHIGELEADCDALLNCQPQTSTPTPGAGTRPTNCMSLIVTQP